MSELFLLYFEILAGGRRGGALERQRLGKRDSVSRQADEFAGVIGQQPHGMDTQAAKDLGADAVIALIRLEAEALVGLNGIEALVLERVSPQLVGQANAAPFLVEIQQ